MNMKIFVEGLNRRVGYATDGTEPVMGDIRHNTPFILITIPIRLQEVNLCKW